MKVYLATWMEDNQAEALTKVSERERSRRLLSYHFIVTDKFMLDVQHYATTGLILKIKL